VLQAVRWCLDQIEAHHRAHPDCELDRTILYDYGRL
jgi:hypothetical protein